MSQESGSANFLNVREFIYLDLPKLQSYLSQIDGGLNLLLQRVENAYDETRVDPAAKEVMNASLLRGSASGKVPFVGEANGELKHERTVKTTDGGTTISSGAASGRTEMSVLHHKIFDVVMDKLGGRLEVFRGRVYLFPVDAVWRLYETLGPSLTKDPEGKAKLGFDAVRGLGVTNVIYSEGQGRTLSAFMQNDFFTIPQETLPFVYGVPTEQHFTLVGIKGKTKAAIPGVVPKGVGNSQAGKLIGVLGNFGKAIDDMFGGAERIYPLALYKEL